jgi:hypothetical protein
VAFNDRSKTKKKFKNTYVWLLEETREASSEILRKPQK